jgi:hypothetical protein
MLIANGRLVDAEGILVGARRPMSRLVVVHCPDDTAARRSAGRLSPYSPKTTNCPRPGPEVSLSNSFKTKGPIECPG